MKSVDHKRPLKVFLCHAHADRDPVRGLYARLTKDGVDAWLDKEKLLPGQDWELEIRKAVREADVVVVCLSKQFNQAGFRQKEVRLALDTAMEKPEGEIFIIPARLEEGDNLESLRQWHWVDLFEENGYENLLRALTARANSIGAVLQAEKIIAKSRQERLLEAAIKRPIARDKSTSLFVWIRKNESQNIISVVGSVDDDPQIDEDNVKSKGFEIEFPVENGKVLPAELTIKLLAYEFYPQTQQKKINLPPEGNSEVCTFIVTPKQEGNLLLTIEVLKGEISLASRNLRTTAVGGESKVPSILAVVSIPVTVYPSLLNLHPTSNIVEDNEHKRKEIYIHEEYEEKARLIVKERARKENAEQERKASEQKARIEISARKIDHSPRSLPPASSNSARIASIMFFALIGVFMVFGLGTAYFANLEISTPSMHLVGTGTSQSMVIKTSTVTPTVSATPVQVKTKLAVTKTKTLTPTVTPNEACNDKMGFDVSTIDVTIPDGTVVKPGQKFLKTWKILNEGSCVWDKFYKLVYVSGDKFSAEPKDFLGTVFPNAQVDVSVWLVAPNTKGEYKSFWGIANGKGVVFGKFFVKVIVK